MAATNLFAERGYEGASVRAICDAANTNANSVTYHFGSKRALYEEILKRFSRDRTASAERILGQSPQDGADLRTRLLLFVEEALAAHLAEPQLLIIVFAEFQRGFRNCDGDSTQKTLTQLSDVLVRFLTAAQRRRLLRKGVDVAIVAGALLERIYNQVRYADTIESAYGTSIKSLKYRRHWIDQTVDLLLFGAVRDPKE